MRSDDVQRLVGRVAAVDASCADWGVLQGASDDLRRLKAWVEGREVVVARAVAALSSFPEKSLAEAGRTSLRRAEAVLGRAETTEVVPALGVSLGAGQVSGEHVDVVTRALRQVAPVVRARLVEAVAGLVPIAEQSTADEFGRAVRAEARRLERDGDGLERLERQRRAIRLNSWIEHATGMGRWSATWDPATMVRLEGRLDAQVEALFHDRTPDGCPTDLLEKQCYLRALALLALIDGEGVGVGRPEIIVVEDFTRPDTDGRPNLDWGVEVDLPAEFLESLRPRARQVVVRVADGVVVDAPGELNLGRTTRLANRAQRRALRGLYATCAVPGCRVRYSRLKLHHVIWWEHGGTSDLANFLPVCERHHQKIHHNGWLVALGTRRELTITLPDGQIMTTGPPRRAAA